MTDGSYDGALDVQGVLDSFPHYVMIIDEDHRILAANHAVQRDLGVLPEEILGQFCPSAVHGLSTPFPGCPLELAVMKDEDVERIHYDEQRDMWVKTAVYPTGYSCSEGRRLFLHTAEQISEAAARDMGVR